MSTSSTAPLPARKVHVATNGGSPPKPNGHATALQAQTAEWLQRSCLQPADLPGTLLPKQDARSIDFYDIDGRPCNPPYRVLRQFSPTHGFSALVDATQLERPKYLHPPAVPPRLYWPVNYKKSWRAWAADKQQPKLLIEGAAKAACSTKLGFPGPGIMGCWAWRAVKHGLLLLPDFADIAMDDCDVYIIFDRDRKPKSVADVLRATSALGRILTEAHPALRLHVVTLPLLEGYDKVGWDDFLFHYSRGGRDLKAARSAAQELLDATPPWHDFEITEPGDAARWVAMYGAQFRYDGSRRTWFFYDRGLWNADATLQQQETTKKMYADLLTDARHAGNSDLSAVLQRMVTAVRVDHVGKLAKSDPAVVALPSQFDAHPLWVNCTNGTLELPVPGSKNLSPLFRPHAPEDMLTRAVAVPYNPVATCPTFLAAMGYWTANDPELQRLVRQLLGLSLTGLTCEQVFILLYGDTQTGKSTLIETFRYLIGNYGKTLSSETLLLRRHGAPEERKVADLPGVRFAIASETEKTGVLDENLIKLLTGEDMVAARRLYQEQFDFMPEAKNWLRTNHPPEIRSTDDSLWRRLIVIPFGHRVPADKKDPQLRDKLKAEAVGIFCWAVEGYLDYAKHGLVQATVVEQAKATYRKAQDALGRFLEDKCLRGVDTQGKKYSVRREELYRAYVAWCDNEAQIRNKMSATEFKAQLNERFNISEGKVSVPFKSGDNKSKTRQEHRYKGVTLQMITTKY